MALIPSTFAVIDYRRPGEQLVPLTVKLPPAEMAALDALAQELGHSRGALARSLVIAGRQALQQPQEVA